jgi:hypothetical protein
MWILDSLSGIPFKKPLTLVLITLGAGFLLLALFYAANPLNEPLLYTLLALDLYIVLRPIKSGLARPALLLPGSYLLAYVLIPQYRILHAVLFSLLVGKIIFEENFRIWKWLASSGLFYLTIRTVAEWQYIPLTILPLPHLTLPAVHGMIFGFCALCSFVLYLLRKDRVTEAAESYEWKIPSETANMAKQARELYSALRQQLKKRDGSTKIAEELEEFTEKLIHMSDRLQKILAELHKFKADAIAAEIADYEKRIADVSDPILRRQYEQTLINKRKQNEQYDNLRLQGERLRAQILHSISALENMRFAYANEEFNSANAGADGIEFFLHLAETRTENVYQTTEAYQKLLIL